jgi:2-polyprenyl-3-methyl-5-hydroxy-6-metoxy-1,4-benzoquinol methylase
LCGIIQSEIEKEIKKMVRFNLDLETIVRIINTSDRETKLAALYKKQDELRTQLNEIEEEIYQIELELFTKRG